MGQETMADESIKIVIIDPNEKSNHLLQKIVQEMGGCEVMTENEDLNRGYTLVKNQQPDIVILNLFPAEEPALKLAKKLTTSLPECTLFITSAQSSSDIILRSMRAGAREFFTQPINQNDVVTAIKSILRSKRQGRQDKAPKGKVISFFGVKGGVGTTTIATNVATALARENEVILVDLNLQHGNAALFLDIKAKYSILDVANNLEEIDIALLKKTLPRHKSGVHLLCGPMRIEEAEAIHGSHIESILLLLKNIFDYIIVDAQLYFDDVTLKAMDESDEICAISTLDIPSIYSTKRCLDLFQRIGYPMEKIRLILNRYAMDDTIELDSMEKLVDVPVFWRIPGFDYKVVLASINQGDPIVNMISSSKLATNLSKLAAKFDHGRNGTPTPQENKKTTLIKKILVSWEK